MTDIEELERREREAYEAFIDAPWPLADRLLHEWLDAHRALREAEAGK